MLKLILIILAVMLLALAALFGSFGLVAAHRGAPAATIATSTSPQ